MKFKIGDLIKCKPGGVNIWVKENNIYKVLDIKIQPEEPPKILKRYVPPGIEVDCTCDMCTQSKPEQYFVIVDGELGERTTIWEGCFELV